MVHQGTGYNLLKKHENTILSDYGRVVRIKGGMDGEGRGAQEWTGRGGERIKGGVDREGRGAN